MNKVEDFLNTIRDFSKKNYKIDLYIADVLGSNQSFLKDAFDILINSFKENYLIDFIKFIYINLTSNYNKDKESILKIDQNFFDNYSKKNDLEIEFIKNLSLHSSRYSLLLKF